MANKCLNSVQGKSDAVKIHKIVAENAGDSSASNNKPNNNNRPSISTNSGRISRCCSNWSSSSHLVGQM